MRSLICPRVRVAVRIGGGQGSESSSGISCRASCRHKAFHVLQFRSDKKNIQEENIEITTANDSLHHVGVIYK